MNTPFDAEALQASPLVSGVEIHHELGSSNDRAKQLATSAVELPQLIIADHQTAGRGRGDHHWWSSAGALTYSLLINPATYGISSASQGLLSIATAVAVIDAVQATTRLRAALKWPNDVLLEGKKLAGILLEAPRPDRLVIGIGMNVNNRFDDAPEAIAAQAISLCEATGAEFGRQAVLEAFLSAFSKRLRNLESTLAAAREACVLTGRTVTHVDGERTTAGVCQGLGEDGALLVATGEGLLKCRSGSIHLRS